MAVRVTEHQVTGLISVSSGVDVDLLINVASRYIDELLGTSSLTADRLADIELYLAAHLVALSEEGGGVTQQRIGATSIQYAQLRGDKLMLTRFGQTALALDTTGLLDSAQKSKANLKFFGALTEDTD